MLPQVVTVGPLAAASANNILTSITPTSGTALTLNGSTVTAGVATLDTPRKVLLTFGVEAANRTLVITGTNATGNPIQETVTVASGAGGTVATTQDFLTVKSALPLGGGWTAAITIGTNGVASSPWKFITYELSPTNMSIGVVVSGTVNFTIEYTYDNPNNNQVTPTGGGVNGSYPAPVTSWQHTVLKNLAVTTDGVINDPIYAWRLTLNSQTNPGFATATGIQAGIAGP